MKIVEIKFSNINNLKGGPHVISFNQTPLSTAGIFAILGPTGSGKSTILDVITLSLFNKIPRFGKAISKGSMSGLGSVITHFADEAFAEITYQISEKKYISKWSVSKTKKGKLKDYEMSLQDTSGAYFDLKRSEVPAKNEEIIGLKYDQFIKSIILSQGEFSKFLKADVNERGQLLENITGTGIYRKIGANVFFKHKEIKASVTSEIGKLGEIHVLNEDALAELKTKLKKTTEEKTKIDIALKKLVAIKSTKTEIVNIKSELQTQEQHWKQLNIDKETFEPFLLKLANHDKISPLQSELTTYKVAIQNQKEAKLNLDKFSLSLKSAQAHLAAVITEMAELTKETVNEKNFKQVMSRFEKEVNDLDAELRYKKTNGIDQRERINQKKKDFPIEIPKNAGAQEALPLLQTYGKQLSQSLKTSKIEASSDIGDLRNRLKASVQLQSELENYCHLILHSNEAETKLGQAKKELDNYKQIFSKNQPLLEKCEAQLKAYESIDQLLKKQKEDANRIATLEQQRKLLVNDAPCPLCGSLDHPFSEHIPEDERSEIDKKISENIKAIEKEKNQIKKYNEEIIKSKTSTQLIQKNIEEFTQSVKHNQEHLIEIRKKNKTITSTDLEELHEQLSKLSEANKFLEKGIEAYGHSKLNAELIKEYQQLDSLISEYKTLAAKRNSKFSGENPSTVCNKLQDKFNNQQAIIIEDKKVVEMNTTNLVNANKLAAQVIKTIQPKIEKFGFSNILELEENLLPLELLSNLVAQKESLIGKETAISTSLKTLKEKLKLTESKDIQPTLDINSLAKDVENHEMQLAQLNQQFGEYSNEIKKDQELRKRRADKESTIKSLNDKLEKWGTLNQLIGDASGNKFANFAQGLTLQNLLVYANKRLKKLSDRYLLDRPADDGILRVVDQYQGNTERAVSTLSGGETFLISLALALSLSDMASKNVSLDSLFIDEGFGTLDQDTLDIALGTLEQLQTESQKTVGVISHVEALKERINVQIRLEKNAQGYSQLKIVG